MSIKVGKASIRMPKPVKMSKVEEEYERILTTEFPVSMGYKIRYEAITFKLAGGNYTPDFTVWDNYGLWLSVECKGGFRLGSAGRSHFAFKAAVSEWPKVKFRFAQKDAKTGWKTVEAN